MIDSALSQIYYGLSSDIDGSNLISVQYIGLCRFRVWWVASSPYFGQKHVTRKDRITREPAKSYHV